MSGSFYLKVLKELRNWQEGRPKHVNGNYSHFEKKETRVDLAEVPVVLAAFCREGERTHN